MKYRKVLDNSYVLTIVICDVCGKFMFSYIDRFAGNTEEVPYYDITMNTESNVYSKQCCSVECAREFYKSIEDPTYKKISFNNTTKKVLNLSNPLYKDEIELFLNNKQFVDDFISDTHIQECIYCKSKKFKKIDSSYMCRTCGSIFEPAAYGMYSKYRIYDPEQVTSNKCFSLENYNGWKLV